MFTIYLGKLGFAVSFKFPSLFIYIIIFHKLLGNLCFQSMKRGITSS